MSPSMLISASKNVDSRSFWGLLPLSSLFLVFSSNLAVLKSLTWLATSSTTLEKTKERTI